MSIQNDFGSAANENPENTWEEALHKLLREQGKELHTEINKPDVMTAIDIAGEHWGKSICPSVGKLVKARQNWYRINMIAFKRKRALEVISGIKGQAEEEKRLKSMKELMLATSR